MELWQFIVLAALGVVAGIVNVIAGGGTLLTLPAMILMGVEPQTANGTNRIAILAQNVTAITSFRKRGFSDFRLSFSLALATLPGAVAGALVGTRVEGVVFNRLLALVMIAVIVMMVAKRLRRKRADAKPEGKTGGNTGDSSTAPPSCGGGHVSGLSRGQLIAGHLCMLGVGFYGGFIQAGVGFLFIAVMNRVMGIDLVRVNMHKVFIIAVYTAAALAVFLVRGNVLWPLGLVVAVGNSAGGWIGAHLSVAKGEDFIRLVIEIALAVMAVKLLMG